MRRIVFVVGTVYLPQDLTGANVSLHALCLRLRRRGFEPIVLCAGKAGDPAPPGEYAVHRFADPVAAFPDAMRAFGPAPVVVRAPQPAARLLASVDAAAHRLHLYFESDFTHRSFPSPREMPMLRYGANSPFLAHIAQAYLAAPVAMVPQVIEPGDYRVARRGRAVLFVNPIAIKGAHIAAAIAAHLPHRHFLFVRTWTDRERHPPLDPGLPNIDVVDSVPDMRRFYTRTRVLLVPSVWEESYGRVVGEAQISGIPAVASDRGGLAENVGGGGIVLPVDAPIARWCEAVEAMFIDKPLYAAMARRARTHVQRPGFTPEDATARFLAFVGLGAG